jgi:hypothetical protein
MAETSENGRLNRVALWLGLISTALSILTWLAHHELGHNKHDQGCTEADRAFNSTDVRPAQDPPNWTAEARLGLADDYEHAAGDTTDRDAKSGLTALAADMRALASGDDAGSYPPDLADRAWHDWGRVQTACIKYLCKDDRPCMYANRLGRELLVSERPVAASHPPPTTPRPTPHPGSR